MKISKSNQGMNNLVREVGQIQEDYPRLTDDEAFVVWFVRAYVADDPSSAHQTLTGPTGEKGLDAIDIDPKARVVSIVQAKYRVRGFMKKHESREDVDTFATVAEIVTGLAREFQAYCENLEGKALEKIKNARRKVLQGYRLNLHYVTLGRCSESIQKNAKRKVRLVSMPAAQKPQLTILNGHGVLALLTDWLEGAAPPVPSLELPINGHALEDDGRLSKIATWTFSMKGNDVGKLLELTGKKLFARNIRGDLGKTKINKQMRQTLKKKPETFWYRNNGITIVCNSAQREGVANRPILVVTNPQIINGQQTTYALHDVGKWARKANVAVRVIAVPRSSSETGRDDYGPLVNSIVEATNTQNQIKPSDLRSNDRKQIALQAELHKLGYQYIRKRASRANIAAIGGQHEWKVSKEDAARSVANCDYPSLGRRVGLQALFDEPYYDKIFNQSAKHIICCYWVAKTIDQQARGSTERQWAKLVAQRFLWEDLEDEIQKHQDRFIEACERSDKSKTYGAFAKAAKNSLRASLQLFKKERGTGKERSEITAFFKRQDVHEKFDRFWQSGKNSYRNPYAKATKQFRDNLNA